MKLLTASIRETLLANGRASEESALDHKPVIKLFTPDASCCWLLTEIDPRCPDEAFGLCDLGIGRPELGYVSLSKLDALRGPLNLPIEPDVYFAADKTLSLYAAEARQLGAIKA